jgi:hypothetical protein
MPSRIEKLQAHAGHLLDAFLGLRERYAMLEPMLFQDQVPKSRGSGKQARGFLTLRHSLFLSCVQDIAKLSTDDDKRTPSIKNLVSALDDANLVKTLRERFAAWHVPVVEAETDPEIVEALRRMELREETERRAQFDEILGRAQKAWIELSSSPFMGSFLTIRDKVAAHTEVQFVADKYQFVDISTLGVKWSDLRKAIELMQGLVESLGLLIRNAGFAWDMLDEQLSKASQYFWLPSETAA